MYVVVCALYCPKFWKEKCFFCFTLGGDFHSIILCFNLKGINMENVVRVGVGVYIFNQKNQVLLGLRKSKHGENTWCPPGGHMEFGETNEQAAIREAKEETNLDLNPQNIKLCGLTNDFFPENNRHYITLHFFCHDFKGTPELMEPNKCVQWQWFDVDKLPENLFLSNRNFLRNHSL